MTVQPERELARHARQRLLGRGHRSPNRRSSSPGSCTGWTRHQRPILIAKNDFAHAKLSEPCAARHSKIYLALVQGKFATKQGRIELAISRPQTPNADVRSSVGKSATARAARTDWTVLRNLASPRFSKSNSTPDARIKSRALLASNIPSSHTSTAQHRNSSWKKQTPTLDRQFLHAARLSFLHRAAKTKSR